MYIDFYELLHGFVKVVTWICQSCSTYFSPLAKQNHTEVWPRFQSLLKLLLWTNGVEWVKVVNAWVHCAFGNVFLYILFFCISPHNRSSSSSLKVKSLKLQIGSEETSWRAMETIWKCKPAVSQFHGFPFWPTPPPPHKVLLSAQIEVMVKTEIIKRTKQEKNDWNWHGEPIKRILNLIKSREIMCAIPRSFFFQNFFFFNVVEIFSTHLRFFGQIHLLNVLNKVHV